MAQVDAPLKSVKKQQQSHLETYCENYQTAHAEKYPNGASLGLVKRFCLTGKILKPKFVGKNAVTKNPKADGL